MHTSMSFTPTSGMMSATRTGDLDPQVALYLIQEHGYTAGQLHALFDQRSGWPVSPVGGTTCGTSWRPPIRMQSWLSTCSSATPR